MKTLVTLIITIIITFSFASEAKAQYVDLRKVKVGAFGGANISNYTMQAGEVEAEGRLGYQVGAFLRYGGRLYLQSGLTFFSLNSSLRDLTPGLGLNNQDKVNTRILQLPVMAGLNLLNFRRQTAKLHLRAGPAFSMLTSVKENDLGMTKDDFQNIWLNAVVEAGVEVWFFTLDAGYQWGLNNAFSNRVDGRKNMATLSLGLKF